MKKPLIWSGALSVVWLAGTMLPATRAAGQGPPPQTARQQQGDRFLFQGPDGPPPPGFRPRFGPGGPGGPGGPERKLVKQFDKDKNGWLNKEERRAARELLKTDGAGPPRFGPPGGIGRGPNRPPAQPGARVSPGQVKSYPGMSLYEPSVLRTLFLGFENADWEKELADFRNTDVEVPATLTVDGKQCPNVGVRFRGASSYFGVSEGYKRSLNVSVDLADEKQRVLGVKTLNLLNSNQDPTFLRGVLYSHVARQYIPAPRINLVRVVINGESWGVYGNAEQFNADFTKDRFGDGGGARWKVPGNPGGGGGLVYAGEDLESYKRQYELKTDGDKTAAWQKLVALCRTLEKTAPTQLEAALAPLLDIDAALKFLALENVFMNEDGYWIRASDFNLFCDSKGKFHLIPHDMNETFQPAMGGPGGGRGPGGPGPRDGFPGGPPEGFRPGPMPFPPPGGARPPMAGASGLELDPLSGVDDARKPLLSKLLAVPSLRARYLAYVWQMTVQWLDWKKLASVVAQYRSLIEKEVAADTRKLTPLSAFHAGIDAEMPAPGAGALPHRRPSLKAFVEGRRAFLLNHAETRKVAAARRGGM